MKNLKRLLASLPVLLALSAAARANDIVLKVFKPAGVTGSAGDIEVTNQSGLDIGYGHRLTISVTRDAGVWSGTKLCLEGGIGDAKTLTSPLGPEVIAAYGSAASGALYAPEALTPTSYAAPEGVSSHVRPCWTLPSSTLSQAETIDLELGFALDSMTTRHGMTLSIHGRLTGTKNGGAVDLLVQAPDRAASGELSGAIQYRISRTAGYLHPTLGAGTLVRYLLAVANGGAVGFRPNSTGRSIEYQVTTPPNLHTIRVFSSVLGNFYTDDPLFIGTPVTPANDQVDLRDDGTYVAPYEESFVEPSAPSSRAFSAKSILRRTRQSGPLIEDLAPWLYDGVSDFIVVDVFVPCSALADDSRGDGEWLLGVAATVHDTTFAAADRSLILTPVQIPFPGLADPGGAVETCAKVTRMHTVKTPEWDDGIGRWRNGAPIGMGEIASFPFSIAPPLGAASITNATIVDRLPGASDYQVRIPNADGQLTGATAMVSCIADTDCDVGGMPRGTCVDGQCEGLYGLRAYYCVSASDFGAEDWASLRTSNACLPAVRSADQLSWVPPAGMTPTHAVLHADPMRPRPWGEEVLGTLWGSVSMRTTVGGVMENTIWLSGTYNTGPAGSGDAVAVAPDYGREPEATPDTDIYWRDRDTTRPFEDDAFYRVVDYQCLSASTGHDSGGVLDIAATAPANCGYATFTLAARDVNPPALHGRVEIDVPEGVTIPLASASKVACPGGDIAPTWSGAAADPVVWDLPADCVLDQSTPFQLYVCADPGYPFVDGQSVPLSLRLTRVVNGPGAGDVCSTNGTSGGVDDGDGIAEANESGNPTTSFVTRVLGRQVATITPVCSTSGHAAAFRVLAQNPAGKPLTSVQLQFAVPVGTTLAAVTSLSPTSGPNIATIDYSADGTNWQTTPLSPASSVAYVRLSMPTLVPYTGEGSFVVELDASGGGVISPVATLTSSLGTTPAASIPFTLGTCRPLTVSKFFDANGDGMKAGASELPLSDWTFTVRSISDTPGDVGVQVASGTTDAAGTWSAQLPAGQYLVHEVPASASAPVSWVTAADQTVVFSDTVNVAGATVEFGNRCECAPLACRVDTCTSLGGQLATCAAQSTNVSCADANDCTIDTCAEPGGCIHDPVQCSVPGFFAPVTDDQGNVVGAIHCVRSAAGVTCDEGPDTDGDGRPNLKVFSEYANRCGTEG